MLSNLPSHVFATGTTVVPHRLSLCAKHWEGYNPLIHRWVRDGVPLRPTSSREPWPTRSAPNRFNDGREKAWVRQHVEALRRAGAIERVDQRPTLVHPMHVVPKKGSDDPYRLVINMRQLNRRLPKRRFRMESLREIEPRLRKGRWLLTFDLKSGYHHVSIEPRSRHLLGVQFEGQHYQFAVLPFGLSLSPWIFSKVVREMVKDWVAQGIEISAYLDDFVCVADSAAELLSIRDRILAPTLARLGWVLAPNKGEWEPTPVAQPCRTSGAEACRSPRR